MTMISRVSVLALLGIGLIAVAPMVARAGTQAAVEPADWYSTTVMRDVPNPQYRVLVDRILFDTFGHGGRGRNLYCEGPAVVRFQIAPDGTVAQAHLVRRSLVSLNAHLLARISNLRFPAYGGGGQARPVTVTFRYGIWDLAKPFLTARTDCR
jgi:hypothetical protein